jgi:teichuronic acid biosynthesis glycosyltransferase TuaH
VTSIENERAKSVLFISHTFDDGVFKVGSHHLAREFARKGFDVAHISTPYSLAHSLLTSKQDRRLELMRMGVRIDEAGVKHLIPRTVLPAQYGTSRYLPSAMKAVGMERPYFLFVDQPLMISPTLFRGSVSIYRPTDLYLHGAARSLQSKYIGRFDAIAATSQEVLDSLPVVAGQPRTVIPNGVEYGRFRSSSLDGSRSGAVYVGALDQRFSWDVVARMAKAHPRLLISLVGPASVVPAELPSNIELFGPMDYKDVPQYLSKFSVGLLPLSAAPVNAGRSPMKLFEYLAAGLYVVATGLPGFTSRDDLQGCFFYDNDESSLSALSQALDQVAPNQRGVESARNQDWAAKAEELLAFAAKAKSPGTTNRNSTPSGRS